MNPDNQDPRPIAATAADKPCSTGMVPTSTKNLAEQQVMTPIEVCASFSHAHEQHQPKQTNIMMQSRNRHFEHSWRDHAAYNTIAHRHT